MERAAEWQGDERLVHVSAGPVTLEGNLGLPEGACGVVLFAHGSGSSRHSSRNRYVARLLNEAKLATLLVDLLTAEEEAVDLRTAHLRFDIGQMLPVAPSAIRPSGEAFIENENGEGELVPFVPPRTLQIEEMPYWSGSSSAARGTP